MRTQDNELQELAKTTYFGVRRADEFKNWTLDRNFPVLDPVGDRRRIYFVQTSPLTANLGELDRLPPEILNAIILLLDIAAVDRLKLVNRRAYEAVNSQPEFNFLNWQAHGTLRGIRAIKVRWIHVRSQIVRSEWRQ
ncbi:hypothetical protein F5884DRAFT_905144 [Xylogone sp. PMI_703]|nr:hypothetical protein F5884DRAFT_905144 [Xylogone sp. PMI_703]